MKTLMAGNEKKNAYEEYGQDFKYNDSDTLICLEGFLQCIS
jgi:hypothetical protein